MANTFYIKDNDTSPTLQQTLQDADGDAVNLTGATVTIHISNRQEVIQIDAAATIVTAASGIVSYTFDGTLGAGNYYYEFEVVASDASIETFPNSGKDLIIVERDLA